MLLAEIVFAYLACTVGPTCRRADHRWTSKYRELLSGVLRNAYLHPHISAAALHFIHRLKQRQPYLELSGRAGLNMFIAALMVANKVIHDHRIGRKYWLHIVGGRLDLGQLMRLEIQFLEAIGWDVTLDQKVFDDFDEIAAGWMVWRQYLSPDFFASRRWDGLRPPAYDLFDGSLDHVDRNKMFVAPTRSEREHERWIQRVSPMYALAERFWEEVPLNNAPFIMDLTENSSQSSSSPTLVSEQKKHLPPPPWLKTPEPTPTRPVHVSHPQSHASDVTYDDLSDVDWTEAEPTESERKLLGLNRPRFLLAYAVATLSLPSMYEKGENSDSRVRKWLLQCEPEDCGEQVDSTDPVEEAMEEILEMLDSSR
ncbi:hypothetical protein MD484_g6914, partial [Candolleomyces efflorescens]